MPRDLRISKFGSFASGGNQRGWRIWSTIKRSTFGLFPDSWLNSRDPESAIPAPASAEPLIKSLRLIHYFFSQSFPSSIF
jgi:hypothetical protein